MSVFGKKFSSRGRGVTTGVFFEGNERICAYREINQLRKKGKAPLVLRA